MRLGKHSPDASTIFCKCLSESRLQLSVFHADHDCASYDRETTHQPTNQQPRPEAPRHHFAQMSQVHRMSYTRANPGRDQPLLALIRQYFGQASELPPTEVRARPRIEKDSHREQSSGRKPTPGRRIDLNAPPRSAEAAHADPHGDPSRKQHPEGRTLAGPPAVRARMHYQPERRNGRVDHACQPSQRLQKTHAKILQARASTTRAGPLDVHP